MNWLLAAMAIAMLYLLWVVRSVIFGPPNRADVRLPVTLAIAAIALIGISMITSRDPAGDETRAAKRARVVLRAWVVGWVALHIAADNLIAISQAWRYVLLAAQ